MSERRLNKLLRKLAYTLRLSRPPQQSPVHAALIAAASQVAEAAAPVPLDDQALSEASVIVYDLETTGLNIQNDSVLSIGAVTIENRAMALGSVFHEVLATPSVDLGRESQLIHGLTLGDLASGSPPRAALLRFLEYGTNRIWAAYHAEFDRIMLKNTVESWLGTEFDPQPIDVAELAPLLFPDKGNGVCPLDHWLDTFGLTSHERHNALDDASVTAELLLIILERAHQQGYRTWGELCEACRAWRQLQRHLPSP